MRLAFLAMFFWTVGSGLLFAESQDPCQVDGGQTRCPIRIAKAEFVISQYLAADQDSADEDSQPSRECRGTLQIPVYDIRPAQQEHQHPIFWRGGRDDSCTFEVKLDRAKSPEKVHVSLMLGLVYDLTGNLGDGITQVPEKGVLSFDASSTILKEPDGIPLGDTIIDVRTDYFGTTNTLASNNPAEYNSAGDIFIVVVHVVDEPSEHASEDVANWLSAHPHQNHDKSTLRSRLRCGVDFHKPF